MKQTPTVTPRRSGGVTAAGNFLFWLCVIVFFEVLLHAFVFPEFTLNFGFALGFSAGAAALLSLLLSFLPARANATLSLVLTVVLAVVFGSQMVYYAVFGSLYALAMTAMGGNAITAFWKETLMTMLQNILPLLLLFLPLIGGLLVKKLAPWVFGPTDRFSRLGQAVVAVMIHAAVWMALILGGTGYFTNYYFYKSADTTIDQAADRFGLLTAMRLELTVKEGDDTLFLPETSLPPEPVEEEEKPVEYNVLDFDFEALNASTDNKKLHNINNYVASQTGTNKNEYTGRFKDYNLIVMCVESFSPGAIDPVLTPTLYKLSSEGFIFKNYYNTYPNTTTDGEYSLCQGLYPDTTRSKNASSFYASRGSYLPFTLGNIFQEQRGITSYGYHNYYGNYYGRHLSHPNMGYEMSFAEDGMDITLTWPASDLELMEQSVDDYINMDQFNVYYMTFSGHYMYDRATNPMVQKNWDAVKDLEMSELNKAYMACNIELEKGMAYLMQRLEEAGVAEKTVIVMTGDHHPYGLSDHNYGELLGKKIDKFNKFHSNLVFWVGDMDEPVEVEEYCCNVDILPTILNLWGFDFDSRMLSGTDVFSDGEHMAVLIDKSVFTDKVWLHASTGEIRYLVDESTLPEGYVENLIQTVKTKFSIAADMLTQAYYNHAFGKEHVWVNMYHWG